MLIQIALSNFYSIRSQVVIDMAVVNPRRYRNIETKNNTFTEDNTTLLKSIALFGANASGKSNLLKAIDVCLRYIRESHTYTDNASLSFEPFKFNDVTVPSTFSIEAIVDGERYEYGFSILARKIVEEHLYHYPKRYKALVFRRKIDSEGKNAYTFSKKFPRPKEIVANTSPYTLFLTRAALMNRLECLKVFNFVKDRIVVGLPTFEDSVFEALLSNHKETVLEALRYADSDIVNYEWKRDPDGGGNKKIITYHKSNPDKPFDFDSEESAGTRRLIRLLVAFVDAADNGKMLIIDELERSLHPQLVSYAVKLFNQSGRAQLIFSTHDLDLMDTEVMRPDQIYFVTKDYECGATDIYSLSDFSTYKDYQHLRRDYTQGRFDAIPIVPSFVIPLWHLGANSGK